MSDITAKTREAVATIRRFLPVAFFVAVVGGFFWIIVEAYLVNPVIARIIPSPSNNGVAPFQVQLSGSTSVNAFTYEWYIDDLFVSNYPDYTHTFTEPGEYFVRLNVSRWVLRFLPFTDDDSLTIIVNIPSPTPTASPTATPSITPTASTTESPTPSQTPSNSRVDLTIYRSSDTFEVKVNAITGQASLTELSFSNNDTDYIRLQDYAGIGSTLNLAQADVCYAIHKGQDAAPNQDCAHAAENNIRFTHSLGIGTSFWLNSQGAANLLYVRVNEATQAKPCPAQFNVCRLTFEFNSSQ